MQDTRGASLIDAKVWTRRRAVTVAVLTAVALIAADQASKAWVVANLPLDEPQPFIGTLLQLHHVRNSGAAFSLGAGSTWIFTGLAALALGIILGFVLPRVRAPWWTLAVGLFIAGITGNFIDRLVRPPGVGTGYVVDFLQLPHWPIFNVADMCIVGGAILLIGLTMFGHVGYDGTPRNTLNQDASVESAISLRTDEAEAVGRHCTAANNPAEPTV